MKTLTTTQLRDKLAALKSATPIAFSALTRVEARKTGRVAEWGSELVAADGAEGPHRNLRFVESPFIQLFKLVKVQGFTGNGYGGYERSVNRQGEREGKSPTFQASERQWGIMASPALVERRDKQGQLHHYLATQVLKATVPVFMDRQPNGILKIVAADAVAPFLPPPSPSFRQQLEKPVVRRDYSLESIVSMALNGERFKILHEH